MLSVVDAQLLTLHYIRLLVSYTVNRRSNKTGTDIFFPGLLFLNYKKDLYLASLFLKHHCITCLICYMESLFMQRLTDALQMKKDFILGQRSFTATMYIMKSLIVHKNATRPIVTHCAFFNLSTICVHPSNGGYLTNN